MNNRPQLLLGRGCSPTQRIADSSASSSRMIPIVTSAERELVTLAGESHVLTVAPPGSRKLESIIIPNALTFDGQLVVVDPTGEVYRRTARVRREMGHTALRIDPFHIIDDDTDAICPLDLTELVGSHPETDAQLIADLIYPRDSLGNVWDHSAFGLLSGIAGYVLAVPEKRTFTGLVTTFTSDDVLYNLCVVLDTIGKRLSPLAFDEIASFLPKSEDDRGRILSAIIARTRAYKSAEVLSTLDKSTVPLPEIADGKPVSIYLLIPPDKLRTHAAVLRLWISILMHCITSRRNNSPCRTLFLLDECAQLGPFSVLESALTLCHGSGLQIWSIWQDFSEVRALYPTSWTTIVRNCDSVQAFGTKDPAAAAEMAAIIGIVPDDLRLLGANEVLVQRDGECLRLHALDYATDPICAGLFD